MIGLLSLALCLAVGGVTLYWRSRAGFNDRLALDLGVFTTLTGLTALSWLVNFVSYNDFVYDPPYFSKVFDILLPAWYDNLVEWQLPVLLLFASASTAFGGRWSYTLLRIGIYAIVWFDWGYMAWSLPSDVSRARGVDGRWIPPPSIRPLQITDMVPLIRWSAVAFGVTLVVCGVAVVAESRWRNRVRRERAEAAWTMAAGPK